MTKYSERVNDLKWIPMRQSLEMAEGTRARLCSLKLLKGFNELNKVKHTGIPI